MLREKNVIAVINIRPELDSLIQDFVVDGQLTNTYIQLADEALKRGLTNAGKTTLSDYCKLKRIIPMKKGGKRPNAGRKTTPELSAQKKEARQEKILITIRAKRVGAQAKKAPEKPQRDLRFIQEEREAWEWLMLRCVTATKRKSETVTNEEMVAINRSEYTFKNNYYKLNMQVFGGVTPHAPHDMPRRLSIPKPCRI